MATPTRDEAWDLFCEWTESESLRRHVLGVEAAMRAYATRYGEDEELWAATGILHDLDYERHPDLETGHPRVALVRPTGIEGLTPKSVKKKMKQPSFAAAVNREELREGAANLGEDFDEHVAFVIAALQPRAEELGLAGTGS